MLLALGAATSALDALKALTSTKSQTSQTSASPFDFSAGTSASGGSTTASGAGCGSQISPATMSALLAAQDQPSTASTSRSDALKDLFAQIDADGDGQLSKAEFENALGAGGTNLAQADDVFGKLDKDGNGTVSLDELSSALKGSGGGHHRHHHAGGSQDAGSDAMLQALQGATSTSVTNSDGSTTTSLTYADGSRVTMTSAAAASSSATSSYNFIEQMIRRQAQAIAASSAGSLSLTV